MRVKCNIPLSDNEIRRVKDVLQGGITVAGMEKIAEIFPYTDISADKDVLYIGKPPWDITQEV